VGQERGAGEGEKGRTLRGGENERRGEESHEHFLFLFFSKLGYHSPTRLF
jgi:hypothetical protein